MLISVIFILIGFLVHSVASIKCPPNAYQIPSNKIILGGTCPPTNCAGMNMYNNYLWCDNSQSVPWCLCNTGYICTGSSCGNCLVNSLVAFSGSSNDVICALTIEYKWSIGPWDLCSSGKQTRLVQCTSTDGKVVADVLCSSPGGLKPITTQTCQNPTIAPTSIPTITPTSAPIVPTNHTDSSDASANIPIIAGITIATVGVTCMLTGMIWWCRKRSSSTMDSNTPLIREV